MPFQTPLERHLERTKDEIVGEFRREITKVNRRLDALEPTSRLPQIPSPARGHAFNREMNVAGLLREAIEVANQKIADGCEKYIQFPDDAEDRKLNSDAKDALRALMLLKIGRDYGKLNWATAAKTTHIQECAAVLRAAVASADFIVFKQSSGHWAIKRLAEQKMKSKGRSDASTDIEATEPEKKKARIGDETPPSNNPAASTSPTAAKAAAVAAAEAAAAAAGAIVADNNRDRVRASSGGRGHGRVLGRGRGRVLGRGRGRGRGRAKNLSGSR